MINGQRPTSFPIPPSPRDVTVLHHDAASRTLVALGQARLGALQASRLSRTLRVHTRAAPIATSRLPRSALFGPSIEEDFWPANSENGVRKRSEQVVIASSSAEPASHSPEEGLTNDSLQQVLPEWYEIQNRHCLGCSVPLQIGVNASFSASLHGIVCNVCHASTCTLGPSNASKCVFRSVATRRKVALSKEMGVSGSHEMRRTKRDLRSPHDDVVPRAPALTLAQRQAELKRKAKQVRQGKASREEVAPVPASPDNGVEGRLRQTIGRDARHGTSAPRLSANAVPLPPSSRSSRAAPSHTSVLPSSTAPQPLQKSAPAIKCGTDQEDVLRQMLAAKRQKALDNKSVAARTGLQAFLGSI